MMPRGGASAGRARRRAAARVSAFSTASMGTPRWCSWAIFASCSTQMADETERSQIIKRTIGVLVAPKGEENASWLETALAGTQDCPDSGRRNRGIDGLVSVPRREKRFPVFALIAGCG